MVTLTDCHAPAADLCSANASSRVEQGWFRSFTTGISCSRLDATSDGSDGLDARNGADGSNESYDDEYGPNGHANDAIVNAYDGPRLFCPN